MADWNDENKASLIEAYEAANPTPETSTEIVAELADEYESTPNGVRAILVRANVYVKKAPAVKGSSNGKSGEKKESKADSLNRLNTIIKAQGFEPNDEIIGRLTGKAAGYFADIITTIAEVAEA
jgi:hypothetical protein